jgi:cytochrome oxidase Cu insertion factor (SCO1/SenC/PrrC family)
MNVTAAINGHITAETSALYSLHFARVHGFSLTLLHILNPDDRVETVEESMANIEKVANKYNMATERVMLQGQPTEALERYLVEKRSKILFCSSRYRQRKNIYNLSFGQKMSTIKLPVDIIVDP